MQWFALTTFDAGNGPTVGIVFNDDIYDLTALAASLDLQIAAQSLSEIIKNWDSQRDTIFAIAKTAGDLIAGGAFNATAATNPDILQPFEPRRIFAAASNFVEHAAEMETELAKKAESEPYIFLKTVESCIGPNETVIVPDQVSRPDWEVELGVVIGKPGKHIAMQNALDHIAGYTIVNDISARDKTRRSDFPFSHDWFRGKSFDTFTPVGPWFVPKECLGDPHDINLGLKINGETMQDGNTSEMIFNIFEQIAYLSNILELRQGDLIASGTPAGVGMGRGIFLQHGDLIEAWVEGIGALNNPVVREKSLVEAG